MEAYFSSDPMSSFSNMLIHTCEFCSRNPLVAFHKSWMILFLSVWNIAWFPLWIFLWLVNFVRGHSLISKCMCSFYLHLKLFCLFPLSVFCILEESVYFPGIGSDILYTSNNSGFWIICYTFSVTLLIVWVFCHWLEWVS